MPNIPAIWRLLLPAAALAVLGCLGIARAESLAGEATRYASQQVVWAALSLPTAIAFANVPTAWLRKLSCWLYGAALCCLGLAHFFPAVNGAHRWIRIGPLGMQPSELAKLATIALLARVLAGNAGASLSWRGLLRSAAVLLPPATLILVEPNLGTAVILFPVALAMLLVAGLTRRQLAIGLLAALCLAPLMWRQMSREQRSRVTGLFAQSTALQTAGDDGYQLHQAKQVRALGGWTGSWLSDDATDDLSAYRLPEARTDFIFSVLGERFGLCGLVVILALLSLLIRQGTEISLAANDPFDRLLATGVTTLFAVESVVNVGMNAGLLPVAGLSLPLVSYGGSGLLAHSAALGWLASAAQGERGAQSP